MSLLLCLKNKIKEEAAFSLLEMIIVITISTALGAVFLTSVTALYQDNDFFNLHNSWQLDSYLAVDFIADQIKNSLELAVINESELDIFTYYNQEYQWLKFSVYESDNQYNLARILGGDNQEVKDFGRKLSLLDDITELKFEIVEPGLLKIKLVMTKGEEKMVVSRLLKV